MELQMMMDSTSSETLNGAGGVAAVGSMWLGHSPGSSSPPQPPAPPPYHRLSPNRQDGRGGIVSAQQVSMGFHESTSHGVLWQDKRNSNRNSSPTNEHCPTLVKHSSNFNQMPPTNGLKRRIGESHHHHHNHHHQQQQQQQQPQHMSELTERKYARRDGSVGSNGSGQGWTSTQVDELAQHLAADFDGPLSALAASDLANAVASYNMSEALLALPSLTVFKQEAPSPEQNVNNSNLNHSTRHPGNMGVSSNEADSNNNNSTIRNNEMCRIGNGGLETAAVAATTTTTMTDVNSPASTGIVSASSVNQQQQQQHNPGNNNNDGGGGSGGDDRNNGQASLHQLLYSNNEDYQANSSSGNHVSSSQQGNESNEDSRFQYVLAAATSIATKINEETLTYLNQGQSYEIKLKKLGDLSAYRGKILKSNIRICFHERRLQYTEREQIMAWQRARPGERLLEVDVPLSYGMVDVLQSLPSKNSVEFMWDPTKEVGVYIKVNCISTEFTPKKHGGEKGVPFRILVETRLPGGPRLHAASCQVKVFKLKGADRKHKQDRDKILRRPPHERDKYQPSYDCTVLSDIPLDSLSSPVLSSSIGHRNEENLFIASSDATSPRSRNIDDGCGGTVSPVPPIGRFASGLESPKEESIETENVRSLIGTTTSCCDPPSPASVAAAVTGSASMIDSSGLPVSTDPATAASTTTNVPRRIAREQTSSRVDTTDSSVPSTERSDTDKLSADANVARTSAWLRARRFDSFQATFASFSAQDILRLSRDDLIQICGLADGIRLFNALHSKAPRPKLTLYFAIESRSAVSPWRVIYLDDLSGSRLASKLLATFNLPHDRLHSVLIQGPQGVHVLVSDELVANIKDESMYFVETIKDCASERYKLLLKPSTAPR